MSTSTLMTVEEFSRMTTPETVDFELVEGELIALSGGTPLHAKVRHNVERILGNYFAQRRIGVALGEVDCLTAPRTVRRPDVSVFLLDRLAGVDRKKIPLPFAPDIAVEVISPSESAVDVHAKTLEYLAAGSQEVWQFDYENGEVFIQTPTGIRLLRVVDTLETPVLPGFSAAVSDLLAGF